MTKTQQQGEALARAVSSPALTNYPMIFEGFSAMGIPMDQIFPRENVFTYHAWRALGRQVRKGEHGIPVLTWIPTSTRNPETGEREQTGRRPRTAYVFHVTQTDPIIGGV